MKKFSIVLSLGLLLMVFGGCSSDSGGTISIKELQQTIEQRIGQEVVVVGTVDLNDKNLSVVKLFKLYKGSDTVIVSLPEGEALPHQGLRSRVTGVVAEDEFSVGVGRKVYIKASSVKLE